jgi:hypothetical protein
MTYSFRTNGNFIDFVHTDNTNQAVESVLRSLHNTSRAVEWSLPEDETRINFTVDDLDYRNILITEIDFDDVAMDSQDDFQTGIEAMFPGYAGGGGGGGNTIYSADDSLAGNRIVDLDGNSLQIQQGGQNFFNIDPASGSTEIRAYDPTDDGNDIIARVIATPLAVSLSIDGGFNDNSKQFQITGLADATTSTLTYTADEHDIVGAIKTGGQATFTGSLADAITGTKNVVNGLIVD